MNSKYIQVTNSPILHENFQITIEFEYTYIRGVSDVGFSIFADTDADFAF